MQRIFVLACLAALATPMAAISETAPSAVVYKDGAIEKSLTGKPGDAAAGAKVMTSRPLGNCVACHQLSAMPDVPFQGNIGPPLDGVADRWSKAELRGLIADAKMTFEGTMMPSFYKNAGYIRPGDAYTGKAAPDDLPPILSAQQVEDILAYLLTLKE